VDAVCPDDSLGLHVLVSLRSSDGALDEQVDGVLAFSSASTAHLDAALQPMRSAAASLTPRSVRRVRTGERMP
jgi:hypothetical protein